MHGRIKYNQSILNALFESQEVLMKLAKHSLFKVLIISSLVIALTGCDAILGKLLPQAELDGPDYPSVEIADYGDGSATLHYGDSKTLTVTASVTDDGKLTYQWYKGTKYDTDKASAISGANKVSYTITAPNEEVAETYYWCKVTNSKNGKTESAWTLYSRYVSSKYKIPLDSLFFENLIMASAKKLRALVCSSLS